MAADWDLDGNPGPAAAGASGDAVGVVRRLPLGGAADRRRDQSGGPVLQGDDDAGAEMSIGSPILWLRLGLVAAIFGAGVWVGVQFEEGARDRLIRASLEDAAKQASAVITRERKQHEQLSQTLQEQADEQRTINARLADELERVRQRANRLSRDSAADCSGASGAELSAADAAFLARLAARADRLRAALAACYSYADGIR